MARGVLVVSGMNVGSTRVNMCSIGEAYGEVLPIGPYAFDCSANDPAFGKMRATPPVIREAGERLYGALVAHEALRSFFVLANSPSNAVPPAEKPLYIRTDAPDAEALPWEVLYEEQREFMALDLHGRWPIARLVATTGPSKPLVRIIGGELRIAVVLAAAQESGSAEWASIAAAIGAAQIPVDLLVIVSEQDAKAAVEASAAQWLGQAPARKVTVEFAADETSLMLALRGHVPNIVHFFCHGQTDGLPCLEIESRADRRARRQSGTIRLNSNALSLLGKVRALWLVVLNCCKGAGASPQLHSLAREIVAAGVPAVTAMRESVDVTDANTFALHFYSGLFPQLQVSFAARNNPAIPKPMRFPEMTWVRAVQRARRELLNGQPADSSAQWTYPVLYVHRDDLNLQVRELKLLAPDERLQLLAELDMMRELRATFDRSQDPEAALQIPTLDLRIREIEAQLSDG